MTRITNADQLHRGMVLTIHHPQTHSEAGNSPPFDWEGCVVTEVLDDHFSIMVRESTVPDCPKYLRERYHYRDCQIISEAVPKVRKTACNWAEATGEKTEEEVQQMLDDDCLMVR